MSNIARLARRVASRASANFRKLPERSRLIVIALGVGLIGSYLIVISHAATNSVGIEPENGTITTPASQITDASASGGKAVKFGSVGGGAAGCSPYPDITPGFPNNCTTGYAAAPDYPGSLTAFSGTIQSNHTYNFMSFNGASVGSSSTPVTNVIFHGCRFYGNDINNAIVVLFGDNLTFEYSTFEPTDAAAFVHNTQIAHAKSYQYGIEANGGYGSHVGKLTISNSDFWGFGNAIDTHASTQAKPQVFRDNWIHDAANDGGSYHTDGIGDESGGGTGSYMVLDHNTIVSPGNTNGIAFQQGSYSNVTITNNLLGGFGYTVALWAPAPNTTFTGNTFTTLLSPAFGPLYPQSFWTSTGSYWHGNHWLVPAGAAYGNPADNGKFWTPNGPSATDYQ